MYTCRTLLKRCITEIEIGPFYFLKTSHLTEIQDSKLEKGSTRRGRVIKVGRGSKQNVAETRCYDKTLQVFLVVKTENQTDVEMRKKSANRGSNVTI